MKADGIPDHSAEEKLIGHSHMDVGAYLVGLWGLPNPVVECAAYHHRPGACVEHGFTPLSAVHIAHAIVAGDGAEPLAEIDEEYVEAIGVSPKVPTWVGLYEQDNAPNGEA